MPKEHPYIKTVIATGVGTKEQRTICLQSHEAVGGDPWQMVQE